MSAEPIPRLHWEDFFVGSVREFGHLTVSREEVLEFAGRFDPQPFHLDDEAARASIFGGLCASGWHTASMCMRMLCDGYLLQSASLGSPGVENLRWLAPVFPGDTLRVRSVVLQTRPMNSRPGVGLVHSRSEVINQGGTTVMTMEGWGMFARRKGGAPAAAAKA